jgi:hypothetical protein
MSEREVKDLDRLSNKVASGRASKSEIIKCMELDRKAKHAENGRG